MLLLAESASAEVTEAGEAPDPEVKPAIQAGEAAKETPPDDAADGTVPDDASTKGDTPPQPEEDDAASAAQEPTSTPAYKPPSGRAPRAYTGPRRLMLLLGPGFGFSFMYPREINEYLGDWADRQGVEIEDGSTAIVLGMMPRVAVNFAPIEYVQIQVVGELGWAPKVLTVIDDTLDSRTESFHFLRFSTGGTVNGHLPVARGRGSVFLGAGVLFNVVKFKSYKEMAPGYRGLVGYRFYGRRIFCPEIFFEFTYINAKTSDEPGVYDADEIEELNYTSGTIGVNFYFKAVEK
jgi:hypothetical protein